MSLSKIFTRLESKSGPFLIGNVKLHDIYLSNIAYTFNVRLNKFKIKKELCKILFSVCFLTHYLCYF